MIRDRVALVLCGAGLFARFALAFVTHAPNRLVSGQAVSLLVAAAGAQALALLPGLFLLAAPFLPQIRATHAAMAVAAASFLVALWWLAGAHAAVLAETAPPAAR